MKKLCLGCFILFWSCSPKKAIEKLTYEKIAPSEVSVLQKERAYELGKRVLMTCNTSSFKPFTTEEATQEVIANLTKDKISITCHNIARGFGQFNDMKLVEVVRLKRAKVTVFRYICDYEKKYRIKELRVAIDDDNKITAIKSKDWQDQFN